MIAVACPSCAKRFKTPDESAGKVAKCPSCGGRITIPAAAPPPAPAPAAAAEAPSPLEALAAAAPAAASRPDRRPPRPVSPPRAAEPAAVASASPAVAAAPPGAPAAPAGAARTSSAAVASLITSILGVGLPGLGLVGIVLGLVAVKKINAQPQQVGGKGVAIAGISVGAGSLVLWLLLAVLAMLLWMWSEQPAPVTVPAPPPPTPAVVETPAPPPAPAAPPPVKPAPTEMYYYDLNTGQLFSGPINAIPPIETPSGKTPAGENAGVKAYVFSCGDCADASQRYIGWMEKADAMAKKMIENPDAGPNLNNIDQLIGTLEKGTVQISEDGKTWVSFTSQEGVALMQKAQAKCGGAAPVTCFP